jgi:hypothetical protein
MELKQETLTLKEVFRVIRSEFGLGEVAENYVNYGGRIASDIRVKNCRLDKKHELKDSIDELIDDYINPLNKIIDNEEVLKEYKSQLKKFFKNFDKNIQLISALPGLEIQKSILVYLISYKALEIYYEIKYNGKYEMNPRSKENYKKYNVQKSLPFDVEGVPNSLECIIHERDKRMYSFFGKKAGSYNKTLGSNMKFITILEAKKKAVDEVNDLCMELFFKRPQWKAYKKLKEIKNGEKIAEMLPSILNKIFNLEKDINSKELMNLFFEEIGKNLGTQTSEKKEKLLKLENQISNLVKNPNALLKAMEPLKIFLKPLEIKDKISLEKLRENKIHGELLKIHSDYNLLKDNYSVRQHEALYKKHIKKCRNSEIMEEQRYFNYFVCDSIEILKSNNNLNMKEENLVSFRENMEGLKLYRTNESNWSGEKIDYLDYYLNSMMLIPKNKNVNTEIFNSNFLEIAMFLKGFGKKEAMIEIKKRFELYFENIKNLVNS